MISQQMNDRLIQIGPGTPMGEVQRRYWHPFAAVEELEERATKPVRLLGEDLVVYKDLSGNYGLLDRHCPHRGADLSYGYVEKCGLRCNYHGWLFDADGGCLEQPFEDTVDPSGRLRQNTRQKAYIVEAKAGLLWAYMGPQPAPLLPDWEAFSWANGFVQIVFAEIPCNWLQCQENAIDPVHFEWMHTNWKSRLEGGDAYGPKHQEIGFDEFEYGFIYRRVREDTDKNDPLWAEGRALLWPNAFFLGSHFEWRVPVDDENTLCITWAFRRVPKEREPYVQEKIPYWYGPIKDEKTGRWITSHVMNQDFVAWVGQGAITDRTKEHLGKSDAGVLMLRRRLLADVDAVNRGEDPKGLVRDPADNVQIRLPMVGRDQLINGLSTEGLKKDPVLGHVSRRFILQYGQPDEVARAYEEAMGFKFERGGFVDQAETFDSTSNDDGT